jgi:hypothetical protein
MACPSDAIPTTVDTSAANICIEVSDWVTASQNTSGIDAIIHNLQHLSLVLGSANRTDMTEIDQLLLSDRFYDVERCAYDRLLQAESACARSQVEPGDSINIISTALLYKACCLTAIIYVSFALREIPLRAGIFNPLVGRLTTILRDIDISTICTTYPKTLLWILGTGSVAAVGRKERRLYVKLLDDFCRTRNIYDWEVMRATFSSSIYLTPRYMTEFMDVWNDVEEFRIMRDLN